MSRIAEATKVLIERTVCWDNHACMPLRPSDTTFLPELQRLRESGIDVVALNVSLDLVDAHQAFLMLATFRRWLTEHSSDYALIRSVADIESAKKQGQLGVFFDIEGGNAVAANIGLVELFYQLGVRWMLIAFNQNNSLGGGCMDEDTGLTSYGRQVIREMERVGMVLCCTHTGHRTAREAMEYSRNPVIFSHSNASAVFAHVRNIPDDLMRRCAATGGVVNINGVGLFLGRDASGRADASTDAIIRHIDYAVNLIGSEHVGLGLDYVFDMSELEEFVRNHPERFPPEVRVPGGYTQFEPERFGEIAETLLRLGYSDSDVQGIMGHNNLRVARNVWKA